MTQEERQKENELLLNVLKDGLPYRLQLQITDINEFTFNGELSVLSKNWCRLKIADPNKRAKVKNQTIPLNYIYIKPYLRPMSSMTEEEKRDLLVTIVGNEGSKYFQVLSDGSIDNTDDTIQDLNKFNMHWVNFDKDTVTLYLDWLNKHYFDYRGLIEKGLALEAPEGMYN